MKISFRHKQILPSQSTSNDFVASTPNTMVSTLIKISKPPKNTNSIGLTN